MGAKSGISGREVQYNAEISRRIEELRVERRVRVRDLAAAAGVTPQLLYSYQVGHTRWPVFRVGLIAAYFSVSVEDLIPETKSYVYKLGIQRNLLLE